MSLCTVGHIKHRLAVAKPDARLAIFTQTLEGDHCIGKYDCVFEQTVIARDRIKRCESFVGVFHNPDDFVDLAIPRRSHFNSSPAMAGTLKG